ncbi:hypothetical protein C2134_13635 [Chromobacterium sinusclupearum]|uniref:Single-stranded DNA-binding protein n=1 Tax=Chromobacterium sinusclupearum TaxID=2077146 RepID=A0A2K4MM30_9NEIS|nr:hypothetical protein [Chromobacterium sinusclupearum]POA98059.1 hypothetical protein C2134_13635 [Chromobacterium sinusclupearum]
MQFTNVMKIMGAKRFNDVVDGTRYDNTKLFAEVKLNDKTGNAIGFAASEFEWGTSENFSQISNLKFPFMAECEMEMVTNGKVSKTVIHSLRPVTAQPAQAAAAPVKGA